MAEQIIVALLGMALLVVSTDQFVSGAAKVANGLKLSSILVGAVILGCGTGLPELVLSFKRTHVSSVGQLLGITSGGQHHFALLIMVAVLVVILSVPALLPNVVPRHSPLILGATIMFATLLRGSLNEYEGAAMLCGFAVGLAWIIHEDKDDTIDPWAPVIDDDYQGHGVYIETPVMTPVQVGFTRCLLGLLGTGVSAQIMAHSVQDLMKGLGYGMTAYSIAFIILGSVLPHVVVAMQALRQHQKALAVGNLIGSNLFQSLVIGGLVAVIRPYQLGGAFGLPTFGIIAATATLTWMMLHTEDELSRKQGLALLGAYLLLVGLTVN